MKGCKVVHNGCNIRFLETSQEVENYMKNVLTRYSNLMPKKVFDRTFNADSASDYKKVRIIRYRYNTLYEEIFVIEFN